MATVLRALVIEDNPDDADLLLRTLKDGGFEVYSERVETKEAVRNAITKKPWHIIFSDYALPKLTGLEALTILKETRLDVPFVLVSGTVGEDRAAEAMRLGAQDYIMKDNLRRLVPAVRRELFEAERRRDQRKRDAQHKETQERLETFKRFFSPQIAEIIVSGKVEDPFKWHRKEVTILFIDLRGFTTLAETCEPEDVMDILQDYYSAVGRLVQEFQGSIGHVAGDGIMIFFNDPVDTPEHSKKATLLAIKMREVLGALCKKWEAEEYKIGFGAGIASGYATIGGIGGEGCWDFSIIGTVTNVASRLCDEAQNGQILVSQRFLTPLNDIVEAEPIGEMNLKGIHRPAQVFNILKRKSV